MCTCDVYKSMTLMESLGEMRKVHDGQEYLISGKNKRLWLSMIVYGKSFCAVLCRPVPSCTLIKTGSAKQNFWQPVLYTEACAICVFVSKYSLKFGWPTRIKACGCGAFINPS